MTLDELTFDSVCAHTYESHALTDLEERLGELAVSLRRKRRKYAANIVLELVGELTTDSQLEFALAILEEVRHVDTNDKTMAAITALKVLHTVRMRDRAEADREVEHALG